MREAVNYLKVNYIYILYIVCFMLAKKCLLILMCLYISFIGSLTKKSKNRGVQMEELKLAPIVDFASGT